MAEECHYYSVVHHLSCASPSRYNDEERMLLQLTCVQGCTMGQITNGENCMGGGDNLLVYDTYHSELFKCARIVASRAYSI